MAEICRWCKEPFLFTKNVRVGAKRPRDGVCDKCAEIVKDIIDYNKERSHD